MRRADGAGGWRRVWLVARREIRERGGTLAFRLSTVVAVVGIALAVALPSIGGTKAYHLGLAGSVRPGTVAALTAQARAAGHPLTTTTYPTADAGEDAVRTQKVDALLVDGTRLEWRTGSDATLTAIVANAMQVVSIRDQAQRLGISPAQLEQLLVPVALTSRQIGTSRTADRDAQTVAVIGVILLFVAISLYGSMVLTGVVQEKSNRVAEVLLSRMPARQLLAGKVLGIGALGFLQFALVAATAGITVEVAGRANAPHVPGDVLAWLVVWFVLGYALYSVTYAGLGALASRVEDAQAAAAPAGVVLIAGYVATLVTANQPGSAAATLLSFLPPTAPLTMPLRIALDAAPAWQAVASVALTAVTIWGLVRVAGRVYSGALLRTGRRLRLREAWRSAST